MDLFCVHKSSSICWGQMGCLAIAIIIMLWLLWSVLQRKLCRKCLHPSAVALRRYHTSFWDNDIEITDLIMGALRLIKRSQGAYEVFYLHYNEDESLNLAASSSEILNIHYGSNSEQIYTPLEISLLKQCSAHESKRKSGELSKLFVEESKVALLFPINVDGFDIGQICVVFEKDIAPESIDNDDMINLVTGLLRYREKAGILENALGRCEADLETMMNATPHGIMVLDKELRIRRINHMTKDMIGQKIEECSGKIVEDVVQIVEENNVISKLLLKVIETGKFISNQNRFNIKSINGSDVAVRFRAAPIFGINGVQGVVLIICDAREEEIIETERIQRKEESAKHHLELQMEQEQRREVEKALIKSGALASAGTLAAVIAHEYNNVNSIAMGNLDVLLHMKNLPEFVMESLKTIRGMMSRGAEITTELLDYTRNNHTNGNKREHVSLIDIAQKAKKMVSKEFAVEGILFISNFDKIKKKDLKKYHIFVDPNRIQQVILNLVLNARHAMIESDLKQVIFDVGIENDHPYLMITDTGHGIPEEDLDRLFDPFFSTKGEMAKFESQKQFSGSGLGLAICDLIMKKNGGSIGVESTVGKGTSFILRFEDSEPKSLNIEDHEEPEEEEEIKDGKGKRVLILDDEEELCKLLDHMLSSYGYVVSCTDDGNEGLKWHNKDPFDLVITDVQMPKMTGLEFLNKLSTMKEPQPKKVVMTGRITKQETGDTQLDDFIQKPFDLIRFMSSIQRLLGL